MDNLGKTTMRTLRGDSHIYSRVGVITGQADKHFTSVIYDQPVTCPFPLYWSNRLGTERKRPENHWLFNGHAYAMTNCMKWCCTRNVNASSYWWCVICIASEISQAGRFPSTLPRREEASDGRAQLQVRWNRDISRYSHAPEISYRWILHVLNAH